MSRTTPGRRAFLLGCGALLGGCLGGPSPSDSPASTRTGADGNGTDGYPPQFETQPEQRSIDTESFRRITVDGTDVPLAPIDAVHYWYRRRTARFADARGRRSYRRSHVLGAVHSPAPDGGDSDPVESWSTDERIVCYCGCPHHLSSLRAANLIRNGYENVYVIDEGFWEWQDRGYPVAGENVTATPAVREIEGRTDPRYAGETAWAWHEPSGQREATAIDADGRYVLELRFSGLTPDSSVLVETPAYRVRDSLGALVEGTVTGDGDRSTE